MIYLILLLGLLLRLISLNQSLWLDEATTALVSKMPVADFFSKFMPADFHPPLYYLILHYWALIVGTSEIALRIPSVVFGILTIYIVFLIAKEIKLKWPMVPALFLATSGLHIYYSQEARMYAMAAFFVSYLVLVFIRRKWIHFSLTLPLIFLTDYVSILILPVLFIYTFFRHYKDIKQFLMSCFPLGITFLVWLPTLLRQLTAGMELKNSASNWWNLLGPVTFKNVALIPTKFMIGRVNFENKFLYAIIIIIISSIFIYVIGKARNKLNWYWFTASLVFGIILSFFIPTLTYFRYLFILPAFYLLLSESKSKLFIVIILSINLLSSGFYLFDARFQRENWREIAKGIENEKIIMPSGSQREALKYYGKEKQIVLLSSLNPNSRAPIWLSRYVWNVFDPTDSTRKSLEKLGYNWTEELSLNGVVFWKYTKN